MKKCDDSLNFDYVLTNETPPECANILFPDEIVKNCQSDFVRKNFNS